jgi:hypothetical protein
MNKATKEQLCDPLKPPGISSSALLCRISGDKMIINHFLPS